MEETIDKIIEDFNQTNSCSLSKSQEIVTQELKKAVLLSVEAVNLDKGSNSVETVQQKYNEAISVLNNSLTLVPVSLHNVIQEKLIAYKDRVDQLGNLPNEKGSEVSPRKQGKLKGQWNLEDIGLTKPKLKTIPNVEVSHRPYWFLKHLLSSIKHGSFFLPDLYIPKQVWFQNDTKILGFQQKIHTLEVFQSHAVKLEKLDINDLAHVSPALESMCKELDSIQNSLAKILTFLPEAKNTTEKSSKTTTFQKISTKLNPTEFVSSSKNDDASVYSHLVAETFNNSLFFETWLSHFEEKRQVVELMYLKRISEFLDTVLINFIVRDLASFVENYLKRMEEGLLY